MRQVIYSRVAAKALGGIAKPQATLIRAKIDQLARDPASLANQVKALKGIDAKRLRVGDYRVIFTDGMEILAIVSIGHRRDIYE